jgi:hypothetical protein
LLGNCFRRGVPEGIVEEIGEGIGEGRKGVCCCPILPDGTNAMTDTAALNALLTRSAELHDTLDGFLGLALYEAGPRSRVSRVMCGISFEHAESVKILTASANFTSAASLLRRQYESVVRALWVHYAASDSFVEKLATSLSVEAEGKASKLPMLSEMLEKLESKAPPEAVGPLNEFREHQWKPLSSFVLGGLHAIHRHGTS